MEDSFDLKSKEDNDKTQLGDKGVTEIEGGVTEKDGEYQSLIDTATPGDNVKKSSYMYVYISHFLSAWGSRMWQFGVGILLVNLTPDSLQLTAVFGLTSGVSVLLLGPLVGDWIDNARRLRAAQITLVGRDFMVLMCVTVIYCYLTFQDSIESVGDWTRYVAYALIITLASGGKLLSVANTITIERDWIVEICASDDEKLATMTATMRGIDLTTQILAPIATGQVMTYVGVADGALFIAGWNFVSLIFEYFLIIKVYRTVPALRKKKDTSGTVGSKARNKATSANKKREDTKITEAVHKSFEESHREILSNTEKEDSSKSGCCNGGRIFSGLTIILEGWKTYASYDVMMSGLSLSMMYMTVLGFDNVTVGYAKIQGLSESVVGIMMGGAGFVGIMGSVAYPFVRRCIGLSRTGMLALTFLLASLSACVVSIWLPGSPFELLHNGDNSTLEVNCTENASSLESGEDNPDCPSTPLTSVIVLMSGIIAARFGLWMTDLSITQMFMKSVKEQERGVVFGVQNSMNIMMDMIKYGIVVALPMAYQFGYLVIISFAFIAGGYGLYVIFICRLSRGSFLGGRGGYQKL